MNALLGHQYITSGTFSPVGKVTPPMRPLYVSIVPYLFRCVAHVEWLPVVFFYRDVCFVYSFPAGKRRTTIILCNV